MRYMLPFRLVRHVSSALTLFAFSGILSPFAAFPQTLATSNLISVADLERRAAGTTWQPVFLRVEGIVRATAPERGLLALQDDSGTTLLEMPQLNSTIKAGDKIAVEAGPGLLSRTRFGIRMGNIPVVENDGLHSVAENPATFS